jgi:hypothetical protein
VEGQFEAVDDNVHGIVSHGIVHDNVYGVVRASAPPIYVNVVVNWIESNYFENVVVNYSDSICPISMESFTKNQHKMLGVLE